MKKIGYLIPEIPLIFSPHQFGQVVFRPRLYIPCVKKSKVKNEKVLFDFNFQESNRDIYSLIDKGEKSREYYITYYEKKVLDMWNEFYKNIDIKVIGFPIWSDEFKGEHSLKDLPKWKQNILKKNRELYKINKDFIDIWLEKHDNLS